MINTTHSGLYFLPDDVRAKLDHCRANDPPERKQRRIEKEIQASGIPEGFQKASFDRLKPDVNQAAHDLCRAFADTGTCGTKNGLLLMGPPGCGKTTLAAAILRKTVERMGGTHSVRFANIPQLS